MHSEFHRCRRVAIARGGCQRIHTVALCCLLFPRMRLALAVWEVGRAIEKCRLKLGVRPSLKIYHVCNVSIDVAMVKQARFPTAAFLASARIPYKILVQDCKADREKVSVAKAYAHSAICAV